MPVSRTFSSQPFFPFPNPCLSIFLILIFILPFSYLSTIFPSCYPIFPFLSGIFSPVIPFSYLSLVLFPPFLIFSHFILPFLSRFLSRFSLSFPFPSVSCSPIFHLSPIYPSLSPISPFFSSMFFSLSYVLQSPALRMPYLFPISSSLFSIYLSWNVTLFLSRSLLSLHISFIFLICSPTFPSLFPLFFSLLPCSYHLHLDHIPLPFIFPPFPISSPIHFYSDSQ